MKISQLLTVAEQPVANILLLHKAIVEHQQIAGHISVHAAVPNLQLEEVSKLFINIDITPLSTNDDESCCISKAFNFDLLQFASTELMEKALLIQLQRELVGEAVAIGCVGKDLVDLYQTWNQEEPLDYQDAITPLHAYDITSATLHAVKPFLQKIYRICHQ